MKNSVEPRRVKKLSMPQKIEDLYRIVRSGEATGNIREVTSIENLRETAGVQSQMAVLSGYYEPGDGGGGLFYYDINSNSADNGGTVIKPSSVSGEGRWMRLYDANIVNIKWFGAKGDGAFDNLDVINNVIDYLTAGGTMLVPEGVFYISDTITITKRLNFTGTGGGSYLTINSVFKWPNVKGMVFRQANADNSRIANILFRGTWGADNEADGLTTDCRIIVNNFAAQGWQGNGITIDSSVSGNADSALYTDVALVENRGHGLYLTGGDSNNNQFSNIFTNANGKSNIYDNSFLGNTYINCHTSFAGMISGSQSWVTHNGTYYVSIYPPTHSNIEPGVAVDWQLYWQHFDAVENGEIPQPWNSATVYNCSIAYAMVGATNYSALIGCYSEGGQGGSLLLGYSQSFGGDHGAGFNYPTYAHIGKSDGKLTSGASLQIRDSNDNPTFTEMSVISGLLIARDGSGNIHLKAGSDGLIRLMSSGDTDNPGMYFTGAAFSGTKAGRTSDIPYATPFFSNKGYFLSNADFSRIRQFYGDTAAPVAGEHAKGDFVHNIGDDNTILGWRCTAGGTPGTWQICYINTTAP